MQKWIFNNDISNALVDGVYSGRFYCDGMVFNEILTREKPANQSDGTTLIVYELVNNTNRYAFLYSSAKGKYIWRKNEYRTIVFDEDNVSANFLTFVQNNATQVPIYNGVQYEDIHINDETLRNQYITLFDNQNYDGAFSVLNNTQILNRYLSATKLNDLTNKIVELENNDDDFDKFFAYTQATQPSTISSGQMWWQIET